MLFIDYLLYIFQVQEALHDGWRVTIMNSFSHVAELLKRFMTLFHLSVCIKLAEDEMLLSLSPPQTEH